MKMLLSNRLASKRKTTATILLMLLVLALLCSSLIVSVEAASIWTQAYGGIASDWAYSVVETPDGGFAIAGATHSFSTGPFPYLLPDFWLVKTDALGNMQWNRTYADGVAYSLIATSDGGYALAGYTGSSGVGSAFLLVKTDELGVYPEYSSWLVPALVLTATAFIIINKKQLLRTLGKRCYGWATA
jgi:hypothetical protein